MQKARNKRLKTDYVQPSAHNSTFIDQMRQESSSQQRRFSSLSKHEPYITRILQSINHEVKYETLDEAGIKEERERLKQKIKDMNLMLTKMVEREVDRDREESRISRKAVVTRDMGMDYNGLCKEYLHNTHKIQILQQEFSEANDKLMALCNPDTKMTNIRKLAEVEAKIKQMREQLGRIRKNKFLREKEMVKTKVKDNSELQDLQLQYITQSKKQEHLLNRLQGIQQQLADTEFGLTKQKEYMEEIKYECLQFADEQPVNLQHIELLYKTHKKKLELNVKRHEREEETKKRKYYHLLLEFQNLKNRSDEIDNKIYITEQRSAQAVNRIQSMFEAFKDKKTKTNPRRSLHAATTNIQNDSGFITEFKDSRHRQDYDTLSNADIFNEDAINQKKFNKGNANDKSRILTKNMGSIVRQKLTTPINGNNLSKSFLDRQNQRYSDQSRPLHHIPHFKTESTPQILQQSLRESSISMSQQMYGEDFEV